MTIRVGIGGWTYEPWRGSFYPPGLPHAREQSYAVEHMTAIEVNGTFYGRQKPETFEKWAALAPPGFRYALKASRYCVNRKVLAEAGESIGRFLDQGLVRLGDSLGPILWQFAATKAFDAGDFAAFLRLLPPEHDGVPLRHVLEPRHESFRDPRFIDMARAAGAAIVVADSPRYPQFADLTADFAYARLQAAEETVETGYDPVALDRWAAVARDWAAGEAPSALSYAADPEASRSAGPRDVFLFFINGAKVRAPAAAQAMIDRVR